MPEQAFSPPRVNPRFSFVAEAELVSVPEATRVVARVSELSSRGCYVDTINPLPVGSQVRLRIRYGSSTCDLPGKVIYAHAGYGMGVLFGEMLAEQTLAINAWLKELARKAG